jgi:hypothetical protein
MNSNEQNFNSSPDVLDNVDRETNDTLVQEDDGTCSRDVYASRPNDLPSEYYNACLPEDTHQISNFLSRPVILKQGIWSSTSSRGGVIANLNFPSDLFGNTPASTFLISQNVNKVDGFVAMKAKVRVRVEVNSQPFQAGILMMHYVPYAEYMNSHTQWYATNNFSDSYAASGCPHVVMNLANSTSMEFVTPYISPYLFFNLATGQGSFGNVVISIVSPLSSAAANSASYTIWANFEDVELRYPTDAPLSTQYAQVGTEIAKRTQRGAISGAVGGVGRAVADALPYVGLGWLSSPARMLSNASEHILGILGFSKPVVEAPVTRVKQSPAQYFLNADGADTSHKLGLCANGELATVSGWAGTDNDEMRLDYIVSRPNFTKSFMWNVTANADSSLFTIPVSPLWTQTVAARGSGNYATETRFTLSAKIASLYSLWRGTMVYTFHVAKTQFHSGRLRVSFRPYTFETALAGDARFINMPAYSYTEEIDLSAGTTFTFRVPFVSVRPWLHTQYDVDTTIVSGDARNCATGTVQVSVINPLMASSTVSNSVEILVYTHMEDAQFAVPIRPYYLPFGIPNVAQVGSARVVKTKEVSETMSIPLREVSLAPYSSCIGETHTSLRQLLKRFSFLGSVRMDTLAPTASFPGSSGNGFVLFPWAPVVPQNGAITNTSGLQSPKYVSRFQYNAIGQQTFDTVQDLYSVIYSMYAFFRGSMRIKVFIKNRGPNYDASAPIYVYINNVALPSSAFYSPYMNNVTAQFSGPSDQLGSGPLQILYDVPVPTASGTKVGFIYQPGLAEARMVLFPSFEGAIEFEVPYHASGHMCPTNYGINTPVNTRSIFYPIPTVTITGSNNLANNLPTLNLCQMDIFRAVGDDFSFGGLLGSPKHALWYSGVDPV